MPTIDPAEVWKTASKLLDASNQLYASSAATPQDNNDPLISKYKSLFAEIPYTNSINKSFETNNQKHNFNYTINDIKSFIFHEYQIYKTLPECTLFFIFYDELTNYELPNKEDFIIRKYFASSMLKNKGWRYHTIHKAWFKRLERPSVFNKDHEIGNYVFFNVEAWENQILTDFLFEFDHLEMF
ncbi:CCR4-NOT transcription complex subunit 3 [Cucumispora dikerogammari]|nr:CCR4-NOT transcription complex subunit 3 [Cucumispora dikerogammari]